MTRKVTLKDSQAHDGAADAAGSSPYRFEVNVFELTRLIVRRRKLVAAVVAGTMLVTAVFLFLQSNRYRSTASILPSGNSDNLSTIKNLVGLGGPQAPADENSSALFPVILSSNLVVDAVLEKTYRITHKSREMTVTLPDYFGIEDPDRLRGALKDVTAVTADHQTGELYVSVETKYPTLSQALVGEYLAQLEDFNLHKRRSTARDNERYLARQMITVNEELQAAEDSLEAFQKANLDWAVTGSPEILKELGRLQRQVNAKSSTYVMLMQQHEMAKLDAQKDIPIVSLLDPPSLPTMKSGPFRRNIILLSGIISFFLVTFGLIVRHLATQIKEGRPRDDFDAFQRDLSDAFPRADKIVNRIRTTVQRKTPVVGG
jgi:tyrosine-protein kinase Etk/Wzc